MADWDAMIRELEATGDYRVLRRLLPQPSYGAPDDSPRRRALILDAETTGLDPRTDRIIELALLPFEYSSGSGAITEIGQPLSFLEDPGRPIPPEVVDLTGITDAMVAGQRIDDAAANRELEAASLIVAHNAGFDRPFVDRRLPLSKGKAWGCSLREVPWRGAGYASSALEFLLIKKSRLFFDGHRAGADCQALLHLLGTPFEDGISPLRLLLDSARQPTIRLWATGAPFEQKEALKGRRYRWSNGEDGRPKAWFREVRATELDGETAWLKTTVYGGREGWRVDKLTAKERYAESGQPRANGDAAVS